MFFELNVAWRFLKEGKSQTIFILIGISIGVAVQVFLYSLISGLQVDLINKTVGSSYHIKITEKDIDYGQILDSNESLSILKENKENKGIKELTNWKATFEEIRKREEILKIMAIYDSSGVLLKGKGSQSVLLKGIENDENMDIYRISENLVEGRLFSGGNEVLIGSSISRDLNIDIGDLISINNLKGENNKFFVSGIYDLNSESINSNWIFADINTVQKIFGTKGNITSIEIQVKNVFEADTIEKKLSNIYTNLKFDNWQKNNKNLLTALKSQSSSSNLIQVFVLLSVALGISSVLAVSVMQKSRQIGILKAMGADDRTTGRIFLLQGSMLGFSGSLLGTFLGYLIIKLFQFGTSFSGGNVFQISVSSRTFFIAIGVSTIVGTISALIPAKNSIKLNPIEVINNG